MSLKFSLQVTVSNTLRLSHIHRYLFMCVSSHLKSICLPRKHHISLLRLLQRNNYPLSSFTQAILVTPHHRTHCPTPSLSAPSFITYKIHPKIHAAQSGPSVGEHAQEYTHQPHRPQPSIRIQILPLRTAPMPKRRSKANPHPPRKPNTRKRRINPTPCRDANAQHAASYGTKRLDANTLSAFPFSEDSILRQLNYMVPGSCLASCGEFHAGERQASCCCCYDQGVCRCRCQYECRPSVSSRSNHHPDCSAYPSIGVAACHVRACDVVDDADNDEVFDAAAYFAPLCRGAGLDSLASLGRLRGVCLPGARHAYGSEEDGEENLKYMTAAWWEGLVCPGDWRRDRGQECRCDGVMVATACMGVETCPSMPMLGVEEGHSTEVEGEGEEGYGGGNWRDRWECEFCGLECFCWTVSREGWGGDEGCECV